MTEASWVSEVPSPHWKNKDNQFDFGQQLWRSKGEGEKQEAISLLSRKYTERSME